MRSSILVPIGFAIATAVFWGLYGPALGKARGSWSPFKPYMLIGVAYLVWGVLGGLIGMRIFGDSWTFDGPQLPAAKFGFLAGSLGAFGALCLTAAVLNAKGFGGPALVMPIVFGGATMVNAVTELVLLKDRPAINPLLWLGMALVVAGIVLVRLYTPQAHPPMKPPTAAPATASGPSAVDAH
ncbi:MAG: hypothetical protein KF774_21770 [Planctomyces sp.]|nr:hypothetical protein [Planctomyces sp.]